MISCVLFNDGCRTEQALLLVTDFGFLIIIFSAFAVMEHYAVLYLLFKTNTGVLDRVLLNEQSESPTVIVECQLVVSCYQASVPLVVRYHTKLASKLAHSVAILACIRRLLVRISSTTPSILTVCHGFSQPPQVIAR